MPGWLVTILLNVVLPMAIKLGVPQLVALIPKLPQEVQDIIKALADAISNHNQEVAIHKANAIAKIKDLAVTGLAPEIKE